MTLAAGTRLGPYEVLAPIGAGGMGEVWKARDTRLGRTVAIKVLPGDVSRRPDLRARFEREARAVAALSHPNICALHDVGSQDGIDFFVMEHLEGETLADRLTRGALPAPQVLRIGTEIADALEKAHRAGVVHRDLKPGNVFLTKSGSRLLDFGLARVTEAESESGLSALATDARPLTEKGTVLGTFRYMSPEQLEGKDADARSDIFALGALLYEMATGKRAFEGTSQASLISSIMKDEPAPISAVAPMAPAALDRVVRTCLAKEPDERWQSAHDVASQLKWISESLSQPGAPAPAAARRRPRAALIAAGALIAIAALGLFGGSRLARNPEAKLVRASVLAPEATTLETRWPVAGPVAVSPDGTRLVFTARKGEGEPFLWIRSLDEPAAHPLAGTEGATIPFWSPDSRFVAFTAGGKLRKVAVGGGPVFTLCDMADTRGGSWSRRGTILFSPDSSSPLFAVPDSGGAPVAVTELDRKSGENTHRYPFFLPDGKHYLYLSRRSGAGAGQNAAILVGTLGSRATKKVTDAASNVVYASGSLLYVRQGTLVAQAFDPGRLEVVGDVVPLVEDVRMDERFSLGVFSASQGGVLVYQTGKAQTLSQLKWFDRSGKVLGETADPAEHFNGGFPALAPRGERAAVAMLDPASGLTGIYAVDLATGNRTRISKSTVDAYGPVWSPDGMRVAYHEDTAGTSSGSLVVVHSLRGSAEEELLRDPAGWNSPMSWSRDGRFLLYASGSTGSAASHLFALPLSGDRKPIPIPPGQRYEHYGQFSPDGRFVAFTSDESGREEVFVTTFPQTTGRWQLSQSGGVEPRWRADGAELFFFAPDNRLMAATVRASADGLELGPIQPLFQTRSMGNTWRYDVSADGSRFLVSTPVPDASVASISLVLDWTALLRRR